VAYTAKVAVKKTIEKYGLTWPHGTEALKVEFWMIQHGGKFVRDGKEFGLGLFHHYKEAQRLLWPNLDNHKWSDLILQGILENRICVVLGSKDSSKTYTAARYALADYFCFPDNTLTLISSTDMRGLELRVWGAMKDLFNQAKARHAGPGVACMGCHEGFVQSGQGQARVASWQYFGEQARHLHGQDR
jgi:hypothetical protein